MEIRTVRLDKVFPNDWNPNEMDEATFTRLIEELDEDGGGVGYIDPVQTVPLTDGTYQIIGGEHRWRALKALGHTEIQVVVLTDAKWDDQDLRQFVTARFNALHGKTNPEKFAKMYLKLADKYGEEAMKRLMGFTDSEAWGELVKHARRGLEEIGVPKEKLKEFDKAAKGAKTIDDLSAILNKLFAEHGNTLKSNFMVFTFGGREHLMVQLSRKGFKAVKALAMRLHAEGTDFGEHVESLLAPR